MRRTQSLSYREPDQSKGKALLAGCIALAYSNMALAEDIKVAVVGAMSGPVAQYGDQE
ncbi:hypothetical protein ACVWBO_03485, partial [Escherichia coli]